jgi:hypothetical protein
VGRYVQDGRDALAGQRCSMSTGLSAVPIIVPVVRSSPAVGTDFFCRLREHLRAITLLKPEEAVATVLLGAVAVGILDLVAWLLGH